jgi:polyhydroxyalkanoate synthase subunit PhaC
MADEKRQHRAPSDYHDFVDRTARSMIAQATGGMAPAALWSALVDWSMHISTAPGKQMMLMEKALQAQGIVAARALQP